MNKHIINMTKKLSLSYEIALSIGGSLDLHEMLKKFLETVVRKGEAYRGLVWLLEDEEPTMVSAVGSFTRGMDYSAIAKNLKVSLENSLKAGTPLLKTEDDLDFLQYCMPFTGNEKEVLLVPIGSKTVLQLFFTYKGAASQGLAGVLEELIPQLSNAIAACQTHRKLLDLEKKEKNSLQIKYFDLMNNLDVGIFICGMDYYFLDANPAFLRLLGVESIKELQQKSFASFCEVCNEELKEIIQRKGYIKNLEVRIKQENGNSFWATLTAVLRPLQDGHYIMGILDDIDERKKTEKKLQYLATHDAITNIPNRYSLEEALRLAVKKAKTGLESALLLIDIDNFKLVNDTLGHTAGDELLVQFTEILQKNIREGDFAARFGGDEFAIIIEGIEKNEVLDMADRIRNAVYENEVIVGSTRLNLSISIGIVLIDGTLDYQKILSKADIALYKAKEEGRNRVAYIHHSEDASLEFLKINHRIKAIKQALREDRLVLYYQPIVCLNKGEILHYEALVRLVGDDNKLLLPGEFIPVAERFGLMAEIDRWVIQAALRKLSEVPEIKIFVNLSAVSLLNKGLLVSIEEDILNSGVDPSRIGFEITETSAMKDLAVTERWLRKLQKIGCRFALDDFGIGFSSFSYLLNLSVDYIKIDGSFVKNIDNNSAHFTLVYAMNKVAHAFGKKTIAECVENESIANTLRDLKVNCGQGYYFGKPTGNLEEIRAVLW
ncbi:EAL domain-containing protein [Desulforamulus putei]|nr:EAL domain-containing protein [Desulforamulus putei]